MESGTQKSTKEENNISRDETGKKINPLAEHFGFQNEATAVGFIKEKVSAFRA